MTTTKLLLVVVGGAALAATAAFIGYRAYKKRNTAREMSAGVKKLPPAGDKKSSGGLKLADFDPTTKDSKYGAKVEKLGTMALDKLLGGDEESVA